jgi:hypothetical protein
MPQVPELNYVPSHPRRRVLRLILAGLVLVAIAVSWRAAPPLWRHAQYRYWQGRCLRFEYPAGTVLFDDDPSRCAALAAGEPGAFRAKRRATYDALVRLLPPCAGPAGLMTSEDGIAFLHERTTAAGKKVLVAAHFRVGREGEGVHALVLEVRVLATAGLRPGSHLTDAGGDGLVARTDSVEPIRVFAGQPHPTDPSRFVIEYESGGHRWNIEGQVLDPRVIPSNDASLGYCGNAIGYQVDVRVKPED